MSHKQIKFTFGAVLLGVMTVQAQSSVVAGGCDAKNAENTTMGITIGQLATETFTNGSSSIFLGIQQDFSFVESAIATNPIPDIEVKQDSVIETINLSDYFITKSKIDFSASSSDGAIAKPVIDETGLTIVIGNSGTATIIVTATTKKGVKAELSFRVMVDEIQSSTISHDITNLPIISVIDRTIYISNMNGESCAVHDVVGKCLYTCKGMMNAIVTVRYAGMYVIKIGNKQQNVLIR